MTDNEIIEALEHCVKTEFISDCAKCEMFAFDCKDILIENALDLINRQKAEIERLQKRLDIAENCIYDIEYASDKAGSNDRIDEAIDNYNNLVKEMMELGK